MKKIISILMAMCIIFGLCSCGNDSKGGKTEIIPIQSGEGTIHGYKPEPIECPDWFEDMNIFMKEEVDGDCIWFGGSEKGIARLACYDTISESWQEFSMDTGEAINARMEALSVKDGLVWALLEEIPSKEEFETKHFRDNYASYIYFMDTLENTQSCVRLNFEGDAGSESSSPVISGIAALGGDRVLIYTPDTAYLTDKDASILSPTGLPGGSGRGFKVNGTLYINDNGSITPLDTENIRLGSPVPYDIYGKISSNAGNFHTIEQQAVCLVNMQTGSTEELFKLMDVATGIRDFSFYSGLENSKGVLYKIGGGDNALVKITETELPAKKPLTLACFGYTGGENYELEQSMGCTDYDINQDLLDAVIRFNNTDPEYKVIITPQLYSDDAGRDSRLIKLVTDDSVDLIDTSFLPENALDSGVMLDMLPFIDKDKDINREDFIDSLFDVMIKDGGLYEYTARFTLLTMTTSPEYFKGRDKWTVDEMKRIISENPDKPPLAPWHRESLIRRFAWAMSGEFIDRENHSCNFDSEKFINWLSLLKLLQQGNPEDYETRGLFGIHFDLASDQGFFCRDALGANDYVVCGFPDSEGSGSYFLTLGSKISDFEYTMGSNASIGIMASSKNQEGAWRFVKILMQCDSGNIGDGIPLFKAAFESALEADVELYANQDEYAITKADADKLREQVYGTHKLASGDERLLNVIETELSAYMGGKYTEAECASQIQSRVSIYLAEQR